MKNLSPQTRQKLAIMLKTRGAQNTGMAGPSPNPQGASAPAPAPSVSPNLQPPGPPSGMTMPAAPKAPNMGAMANPVNQGNKMFNPRFFHIKNRLKPM